MGAADNPRNIAPFVEMYYESLYRYAFRLSGCAADAEDLTQETFCKAQAQFRQLRDLERVKPWMFSILRHAFLHCKRSEKHQKEIPIHLVGDISEDDVPDNFPEIEPSQLQDALNRLPEVFRTPIILYYFEGFSYRDIAEQMDLPIGTVMSRLARAKAYLKDTLAPKHGRA
jgi:RNA polymerase sigma-70 factor (ECF subfamily)